MQIAPEHEAILGQWLDSLPAYAEDQLKVVDKSHRIVPFRLNRMQRELHNALEQQKAKTGRVRAIIVKARQLGASTYIAARFFHQLHLDPNGHHCFVLAHDQPTSIHLGRMIGTFYEQLDPALRREAVKANDLERSWMNGSVYNVRTASTPSGGRGGTVTLYHSSEVAYQEHAEAHILGSGQQVGQQPGTEMLYESTAAGPVGPFYEMFRAAEQGRSEHLPLFFPWTLEDAYSVEPPMNFTLSRDVPNDLIPCEYEYAEAHQVSLPQMAWRRAKIEELASVGGDGSMRFSQEYPITADEAFGGVDADTYFDPRLVNAARHRPTFIGYEESMHPLVIGVDPSPAHGGASTAIVWRQGRIAHKIQRLRGLDPEEQGKVLVKILTEDPVARMCIDESEGTGHFLVTYLARTAVGAGKVMGVQFGGRPDDRGRYANKKAEMAARCAQWIAKDAAIVNELGTDPTRTIIAELLSIKQDHTQEKVLRLESKAKAKNRGVPSPDGAEALFLTFAAPEPASSASLGYHRAMGGTFAERRPVRAATRYGGRVR